MVSINGSGLQGKATISITNNRKSALVESHDHSLSRSALEYQEQLRRDVINQTMDEQCQPDMSLLGGSGSMDEVGLHLVGTDAASKRKIVIVKDNCDLSSGAGSQVQVSEGAKQDGGPATPTVPFARTIEHMRHILSKKSAPMQKIIGLNENRAVMAEELAAYQARQRLASKVAGQDQKDNILRYVVLQSNVGDLYCQKTLVEEFALQYISENTDGNVLAKVYLDFCSAVDYLHSLDREQLRDGPEQGSAYLRDFNLKFLTNCLYQYPEDQTDEVTSQATSYNMFGDFQQSVRGGSIDSRSVLRQVAAPASNQLKRQAQHMSIGKYVNSNAGSRAVDSSM